MLTDEPIKRVGQDRLGRAAFAQLIADRVRSVSNDDALVLAVNGPWGSGKTSLLNLVDERLRDSTDESQPVVVRFNPWMFSTIDQLIVSFFAALGSAIEAKRGKKAKVLNKLLATSDVFLGTLEFVPGSTGQAAARLKKLGKGASLEKTKSKINKAIKDLDLTVVVFIDDIDRLEPDAIKLLLRLVRLNGDFANFVYILSFDRTVVRHHLRSSYEDAADDYLEKIIQLSFDMPRVEGEFIWRILHKELDRILDGLVSKEEFNVERWSAIWNAGFKDHFVTVRDVKRYVNSVGLTLPAVAREVNVVDFLSIELIRVFHPDAHAAIYRNKELFVPSAFATGFGVNEDLEKRRKEMDENFEMVKSAYRDATQKICRKLFPQVDKVYTSMSHSGANWSKEKRICSGDFFDRYFYLALPTGQVSEVAIDNLLGSLSDKEAAGKKLRALHEAGTARSALERLEDRAEGLDPENATALATLVLTQWQALEFPHLAVIETPADWLKRSVVAACFERLEDEDGEESAKILREALEKDHSVFAVSYVVFEARPKNSSPGLFGEKTWNSLRDATRERILELSQSDHFWSHEAVVFLLYRLKEWAGEEELEKIIDAKLAEDPIGLVEVFFSIPEESDQQLALIDRPPLGLRDLMGLVEAPKIVEHLKKSRDAKARYVVDLLGGQ